MDVADERGGRVPVSETFPLALRGLWMRARGSVAFWGGLVVIVMQVWVAATSELFTVEDSTTSYVRQLDQGLYGAVIVLGLLAGWAGSRARIARLTTRARLQRFASDSWPLIAATSCGYLIALVVLVVRFGVPWPAWPTPVVVASQALLVLTAIAIGGMLGAVLPRVLVIFVAPAAVGAFVAYGLSGHGLGTVASFRIYFGIAYVPDLASFARGAVLCGLIVALAIAVVAVRPLWLRALPVAALVTMGVIAATVDQSGYTATDPVPRAESDLICSEAQPVVCLWPEQEAAFGAEYREQISTAYDRASEAGLPVDGIGPRSVTRFAMTGIASVEGISVDDMAELGFGYGLMVRRDQVLNAYASSMTDGLIVPATEGYGDAIALQHSIAVVLGVPVDQTWQVLADPYTGQRFLDPAEAPDEAESRVLVARWLAEGVDGVHAPA